MNNLMRQLLDDWKPFIKKDHWDEFVAYRMADVEEWGDIVRIEDVYYPNSTQLMERRYYNAFGTANTILAAVKVVDEDEELILAPIPDLIVDKPARKPAIPTKRKPARVAAMEAVPA